jgi:hypothetical protein
MSYGDIVATVQEAEHFFLNNSSGVCVAVNSKGEKRTCDCYPDAVAWIESKEE